MKAEYTKKQMVLWGQVNTVAGCAIVTFVYLIMGLLGFQITWFWQGVLFVILSVVGYLYYRLYKQTKEKKTNDELL